MVYKNIFLRQHKEILECCIAGFSALSFRIPSNAFHKIPIVSFKQQQSNIAKFESTTGISFTVILPLL
jgi:hypothetical protein